MRTNTRSKNVPKMIAGLLLFIGMHLTGPGAQAQTRDSGVSGFWRSEDGVSIVEIRRCGDTLCGYLVSFPPVAGDPQADAELCNLQILGGFRQGEDRRWVDGWILDPEAEQAYRAELTPDGTVALDVRAGDGLFGENVIWHREMAVDDRCTPAR